MDETRTFKWIDLRLLIAFIVVTSCAILLKIGQGQPVVYGCLLLEAALYFSIVQLFWYSKGLRRIYSDVNARTRVFLAAIFLLTIFAQMASLSRPLFPFVAWQMYTESIQGETVEYFEFKGQTRTGRDITLIPAKQFPSLDCRRLISLLSRTITQLKNAKAAELTARAVSLNGLLSAWAQKYNRDHPTDQIQIINIYEIKVRVDEYRGRSTPKQKKIIWQFTKN